jgi:hypothetical protein
LLIVGVNATMQLPVGYLCPEVTEQLALVKVETHVGHLLRDQTEFLVPKCLGCNHAEVLADPENMSDLDLCSVRKD